MPSSRAQQKAFWAALLIGVSIAILWIFVLPKRVPSDTITDFGASTQEFTQEANNIWTQTQESRNDVSQQLQEARQDAQQDTQQQDAQEAQQDPQQTSTENTSNDQSPTQDSLNSPE